MPTTIATTLNIAGASAGDLYRSWALSMPIATTASEITGRNGIMIRISSR